MVVTETVSILSNQHPTTLYGVSAKKRDPPTGVFSTIIPHLYFDCAQEPTVLSEIN
jgi:hypothetical protein